VAGPEHMVTGSAFAMDKWEVSIELWESVRGWGNTHGYDLVAGGSSGAKHPVNRVNWWDVVKWCNARSEKEGLTPVYTTPWVA
jgi:formylglycine-generating enzyme required for sulfatase activity